MIQLKYQWGTTMNILYDDLFFFMQKLSYCSLALILRNAQALRNWSVVTSFGPLYKGFKRDLQWTFHSMRKETIQIWGTGSYSRPSELMIYSLGLCDLGWPWKQYGPFSMPYFIFVCHFIDEWPWKKITIGHLFHPPPPPPTPPPPWHNCWRIIGISAI